MNTEKKKKVNVAGDLLMELEEAKKTDCVSEEAGPYSITYAFGGYLSIICC